MRVPAARQVHHGLSVLVMRHFGGGPMRSNRAPRQVRAGQHTAWRSRTLIVVLVLALGAALTLSVRAALSGEALDPPPAAPATS
jgi:hypothetical protein